MALRNRELHARNDDDDEHTVYSLTSRSVVIHSHNVPEPSQSSLLSLYM